MSVPLFPLRKDFLVFSRLFIQRGDCYLSPVCFNVSLHHQKPPSAVQVLKCCFFPTLFQSPFSCLLFECACTHEQCKLAHGFQMLLFEHFSSALLSEHEYCASETVWRHLCTCVSVNTCLSVYMPTPFIPW